MWFNVTGAVLGFLGSIIFSAALIKPKTQIIDENRGYWDENPFTTSSSLGSQPYFITAFILLITGFAVSIGGELGQNFKYNRNLISILFVLAISLFGYLATAMLYIFKNIGHQKRKVIWLRSIFINAARTYANDMRGIIGKDNEKELFTQYKETYQKDLKEKAEQIPETDNDREVMLFRETAPTNSAKQFY